MSKPTIHDVARLAGVSIKTVSRVLNGEPKASPATRERVKAAVLQLNYSPNLSARSLSAARNFMIAFVFGTYPENTVQLLTHEYVAGLQVGAVTAAQAAGFHLLMEPLDLTSPGFTERAARLIAMPAVDGFIIMPGLADDPRLLAVLEQRPGLYVRVSPGVEVPSLPAMVRIDDDKAARDMTRYLLGLGHRRIGFIGGRRGFGSAELRQQAFKEEMEKANCYDPALVVDGDYTMESGQAAGERLLSASLRPTAIFAANDSMALGVLAQAHRRGVRVPDDLSVAGIDDIRMASSVWPSLTTVRQPIMAMGAAAANHIIASTRSGARPAALPYFAHELVVRESTAPPAGN